MPARRGTGSRQGGTRLCEGPRDLAAEQTGHTSEEVRGTRAAERTGHTSEEVRATLAAERTGQASEEALPRRQRPLRAPVATTGATGAVPQQRSEAVRGSLRKR